MEGAGSHSSSRSPSEKSGKRSPPAKSGPDPPVAVSSSSSGSKLLSKRGKEKPSYKRGRVQSMYSRRSSSIKSTANGYTARSGRDSLTVMKTRGYSIIRSPSGVEMNINTPAFFGEEEGQGPQSRPSKSAGQCRLHGSRQSSASAADKALETRLAQLNLAHVELQTELEEMKQEMQKEKEEHETLIEELQAQFKEDRDSVLVEHEKEMTDCTQKHKVDMNTVQTSHKEKTEELKGVHAKEKADLKAEMRINEELHAHSMTELQKEHEQNTYKLKQRLKKEHAAEMETMEMVLREDSSERIRQVKQEISLSHQEELQTMKEQHQIEMETMLAQFSKIHEMEEELTKNKKHIKKLERQSSKFKADMYAANTKQHKAEAQLLQTQNELEKFKADFQNKIRDSQAQTKDRLDDLLLENSQLRRKLLLKSAEFSDYRSNIESISAKTIRNYKEKVHVMVRARQKANLSVAMGLSEQPEVESKEPRPSSAPVTRRESSKAARRIISSEPDDHPHTSKQLLSLRPKSCLAHITYTHSAL